MKIDEIHEHIWDRFVLTKEHGYILYSHISVFQREINCLNKENENRGFRENMNLYLQNTD